MAKTSGAIRTGRAFVELFADDSRLVRSLRRAQARLRAFGQSISQMGKATFLAGAALVAPILAAGRSLAGAASRMEETMNKFNVVFADRAAAVRAWGDELANQVGRSERQIAEFMAGNQDLFVPLGFEPGAAEAMSKQVTQLAIDLASFNNKADADTMRDLQAALTGSGEVMKKYGVIVSEAAIKQEALNRGINPAQLTEQQKVLLRMNIIMAGTTAAQGDALRSANSYANTLKRLQGKLEDVAGAIGAKLLPVITPWIARIADALDRGAKWAKANGAIVTGFIRMGLVIAGVGTVIAAVGATLFSAGIIAIGLAATLGALAKAWLLVGVAIKGVIAALAVAKVVMLAMLSPIGLVIAGSVAIGAAVLYATGVAGQALDWLKARFASLGQTGKRVWEGIKDAMAAGDFNAAARVMWAGLKLEWKRGTQTLTTTWIVFRNNIVRFGREMLTGLQSAWAMSINWITNAWRKMFVTMIGLWNKFQDYMKPVTLELAKFFTIAVGAAQGLSAEESLAFSDVEGEVDREINRRKARLDEITQTLQVDIDASGSELDAKLAEIAEAEREFMKQLDQNQADEIADAAKGLSDARREFEQALAAARAGREVAEQDQAGEGMPGEGEDFAAKMEELLYSIQQGAETAEAAGTQSARGTFDPSAIAQQFAPTLSIEKEQRDLLKRAVGAIEPMQRGVEDIRTRLPAWS